MKKLFKRNTSKKLKTNLDGSFANVSVDSIPGRPISQLSNYSADSNYSLSNLSIGESTIFIYVALIINKDMNFDIHNLTACYDNCVIYA